jgi:hypothetical protein
MKLIQTNDIEVKVYNTKSLMRRAIRRLGYECGHTESMVIPVEVYNFRNGVEKKMPMCAEMYLHKNVSLPVLVHETLHAATSVLRSKRKNLDLGSKITKNEERLAYMQTSILQDILKEFFPKSNSNYDLSDLEFWVNGSVKGSIK